MRVYLKCVDVLKVEITQHGTMLVIVRYLAILPCYSAQEVLLDNTLTIIVIYCHESFVHLEASLLHADFLERTHLMQRFLPFSVVIASLELDAATIAPQFYTVRLQA